MIGTLATLAALSTSPAVLPKTEINANGRSRADELAERFSRSGAAFAGAAQGWYSGRCYRVDSPDTAMGVLLVTETRNRNSGEGPIFDRPVTKMVPVVHNPGSQQPEFFDNLTPQLANEVENFLTGTVFPSSDFSETFDFQGSLSSSQFSLNTRWDQRVDSQFQFIRTFNTTSNSDFAYCYFFKKVR